MTKTMIASFTVTHVKEDYLTFYSISRSADSRNFFWDISENDKDVYRLSTFFCIVLRFYIEHLISSHSKKEVYGMGDSISYKIGFVKNNLDEIILLQEPQKTSESTFPEQQIKDFADLTNIIEKQRRHNGLGNFPEEIMHFLALLRNPTGVVVIGNLESAWVVVIGNLESVWYVAYFRSCSRPISSLNHKAIVKNMTKTKLQPVVQLNYLVRKEKRESVNVKGKKEAAKSAKVKENKNYKNTFKGLVTFIRNITAHAAVDSKGNVYGVSEIERKLDMQFPFYMYLLCTMMIQVNLYHI